MVAVRLPEKMEAELTTLAKETGRTKSFFIVEALNRYLTDMSDRFELERALKEFYEGGQRTYSLDEVERELDL